MASRVMHWSSVERVHIGEPAAEALRAEAEQLAASRVFLLVSGHLRRATDEIAKIEAALGPRHAATWSGMVPHAPRTSVLAAAEAARQAGADLIVSVGGGSVTDAAKIAALLLKHNVTDTAGFEPFRTTVEEDGRVVQPVFAAPDIRVVCLPTTLSGGEFNPLAGATDELTQHKQGYMHRMMAPVAVVLDPVLTRHTPEWLFLSTGVRAADHAVETLASYHSGDFCDGVADSALRLLAEGLPRIKADPGDSAGRLKCQIGAWQSMIPIVGGVPMGASHAIGHILGGSCDVPHGYTSCVMSPFVLAWNAESDTSRQGRISDCLGAPGQSAASAFDRFIRSLGMPRRLAAVGVGKDRLTMVADYTLKDIWGRTNPRPIATAADVLQILERAW